MYEIHQIDSCRSEAVETLGARRKFWFRDNDSRILFKAEERNTGEDWAEKVVCELAELLGLPHVQYELAQEVQGNVDRWPGVICASCLTGNEALVLGNQLLLAIDPEYPVDESRRYKVSQHTVAAVTEVLKLLQLPDKSWISGMPSGIQSALDVFAGYVLLDAWVANQDRHHQNWAAIYDNGTLKLAPSFDHGASLARNLSDDERRERLITADRGRSVKVFAGRARSAFYGTATDSRPLRTYAAFWEFLQMAPRASVWLDRLSAISSFQVEAILQQVPALRMTKISKAFTMELLETNRGQLLAGR